MQRVCRIVNIIVDLILEKINNIRASIASILGPPTFYSLVPMRCPKYMRLTLRIRPDDFV